MCKIHVLTGQFHVVLFPLTENHLEIRVFVQRFILYSMLVVLLFITYPFPVSCHTFRYLLF